MLTFALLTVWWFGAAALDRVFAFAQMPPPPPPPPPCSMNPVMCGGGGSDSSNGTLVERTPGPFDEILLYGVMIALAIGLTVTMYAVAVEFLEWHKRHER